MWDKKTGAPTPGGKTRGNSGLEPSRLPKLGRTRGISNEICAGDNKATPAPKIFYTPGIAFRSRAMSSIKSASDGASIVKQATLSCGPHSSASDAARPGLKEGKSIFDFLTANELTGAILTKLLPSEQRGWAQTCRHALYLSNKSFPKIPARARMKKYMRAAEWTRQFRSFSPLMQSIVELTARALACPDIFSPSEDITKLRDQVQAAMQVTEYGRGVVLTAYDRRVAFEEMDKRAQALGVTVPDLLLDVVKRSLNLDKLDDARACLELLKSYTGTTPNVTKAIYEAAMQNLAARHCRSARKCLWLLVDNAGAASVRVPFTETQLLDVAKEMLKAGEPLEAHYTCQLLEDIRRQTVLAPGAAAVRIDIAKKFLEKADPVPVFADHSLQIVEASAAEAGGSAPDMTEPLLNIAKRYLLVDKNFALSVLERLENNAQAAGVPVPSTEDLHRGPDGRWWWPGQ